MNLSPESASLHGSRRPRSALAHHGPIPERPHVERRASLSIDFKRPARRSMKFSPSATPPDTRIHERTPKCAFHDGSDSGRTRHATACSSVRSGDVASSAIEFPSADQNFSDRLIESNAATTDSQYSSSEIHGGRLSAFVNPWNNKLLQTELRGLETYGQFKRFATQLGKTCSFDDWRNNDLPNSSDYDVQRLKRRLHELEKVRCSRNPDRMLHFIRAKLSRHLGDMDGETLFHPYLLGTKKLIEEYTDAVCGLVADFTKLSAQSCDTANLLRSAESVREARLSFGKTALMCSGGGTFGMRHIGTIKCLFETGNLPRVISGASAGSIVCAVLCAKTDDQLATVLESFCHGDLKVFVGDDEGAGWNDRLAYFRKRRHFFNARNLARVMQFHLGNMTFSEAYQLTGRVLNVTVSSGEFLDTAEVLNYATAGEVLLWSAVVASCALPLTYEQAPLYMKTSEGLISQWSPGVMHVDGSIENDLPFDAVQEQFNINHYVVAQVNPHVVPFLEDKSMAETPRHPLWVGVLDALKTEVADWLMPVILFLPNARRQLSSIVGQKYSGHITILPKDWMRDLPNVLRNPTTQFMEAAKRKGEQATWERISIIENHMKIERALEMASDTLWKVLDSNVIFT